MQEPRRSSWGGIAAAAVQAEVFDPLGRLVRASTRSFRTNGSDYRRMRIAEAITALSRVEPTEALREDERERVEARLDLSGRLLGGFVSDKRLPFYYQRTAVQASENRGHNWELLRQRSEANGLYFQPLDLTGNGPGQALLWLAKEEIPANAAKPFDAEFLRISNPWADPRLQHWKHYEETWHFDSEGQRVSSAEQASKSITMVPLALYSLDYKRVPLLLADFRDQRGPRRREMIRRASTDITTGLLGVTRMGSWEFMALSSAWDFYTGRHGAANDRSARVRAYAQLRYSLTLDRSLSADLRTELLRHVDKMAVNPLDSSANREEKIANQQYAALLRWAGSPSGLGAQIVRWRGEESAKLSHTGSKLVPLANILSLGMYRHREEATPERIAEISRRRKIETHTQFLEQVLASGPKLEVAWNMDDIEKSLQSLSRLAGNDARERSQVQAFLSRILQQTADSQVRAKVLAAVSENSASGTE
jgi:hypothetical protein